MSEDKNLPSEAQNTIMENQPSEGTFHVVLPCDVKDFKGFVAGLLGKPQEKKGEIEGVFQLTPKEITNICHLVTQRVSRQNEASLISLSITAHYDDGDSVTHHNIIDFESYHPTTPCKPVGISIDFIYLIKFQGRDVPEKQEINVSIETDMEYGHRRVKRWFRSGIFIYHILHTERTWAADISGLLKGHAASIIKTPSAIVNFISKYNSELITYLGIIIFSLVMIFWSSHTILILDNPIEYFKANSEYSLTKYWVVSITILSLLLAVLTAINSFFQYHVTLRPTSTIVLTEADVKNLTKTNTQSMLSWILYTLGWAANLIAGIVATHYIGNIF